MSAIQDLWVYRGRFVVCSAMAVTVTVYNIALATQAIRNVIRAGTGWVAVTGLFLAPITIIAAFLAVWAGIATIRKGIPTDSVLPRFLTVAGLNGIAVGAIFTIHTWAIAAILTTTMERATTLIGGPSPAVAGAVTVSGVALILVSVLLRRRVR